MTQEIVRELVDGVWVTRPKDQSGGGGSQTANAIAVTSLINGHFDLATDCEAGVGARVLVQGQSVAADDGVYIADTDDVLSTRDPAFPVGAVIGSGAIVTCYEAHLYDTIGSALGSFYSAIWMNLSGNPFVIGTDQIAFSLYTVVTTSGDVSSIGAPYLQAAYVDPASMTFPADLVAALQSVGLMAPTP